MHCKMVFGRSVDLVLALLILPYFVNGQRFQSLSYRIVNGKVYVDPPTTPAPTFMESWFPWLSSSYTSSNSEAMDEAIINSVTGPPVPESPPYGQNSGSGILSLPSFSQYPPSSSQSQSPYLSNEEDNYIPSGSVNAPLQMKPEGYSQQMPQPYSNVNHITSQFPPPVYSSSIPQLPYPFSDLPGQTTTSAPFYQPILDFFGYGSSSVEDQLPLPFGGGSSSGGGFSNPFSGGSYGSNPFSQGPFQQFGSQFAQARESNEDGTKYIDDFTLDEGKYSSNNGPKSDTLLDDVEATNADSQGKFPCPKLGFWHWNGEVCIAVGPVPIWACKPNDLVMSGRVGVCRNKIFFPPGSNPLGDK